MSQGAFDANNKNAVITGGASGIGYAIAKAVGRRNCRVLLADLSEERLAEAVES